MQNETALARFRSLSGYQSGAEGVLPSLLNQIYEDKSIDTSALRLASKQGINLGGLIRSTLLRNSGVLSPGDYNLIAKMAFQPVDDNIDGVEEYDGSPEQNVVIDRSLTIFNRQDAFIGEAAMANLVPPKGLLELPSIEYEVKNVPIAIIGRGPAGILVNAALHRMGFSNITMFDKRASNLGIWAQPNVAGGTKNNPRVLSFENVASLEAAKGDGSKDGSAVATFVRKLAETYSEYGEEKIIVKKIVTGNFKHIVHFEQDGQAEFTEFPIVINCMGTGKPRPFTNDRMRYVGSEKVQAVRWQQQITRADVEGKNIAIIGLGNSTAEMMHQLNRLREEGAECDYRIFTHYPEDAILNPNDRVYHNRKYYRLFRDLSRPDLTGFQGDLPRTRQDYFQALDEERIVSDVRSWKLNGKYLNANVGGGDHEYRFDKLFALTGYEQDRDLLKNDFSIHFKNQAPVADYDGEFRDDDGDIQKGYFGLGALMDSPHDPNSVVLPGMMFRMPDMLFTIVARAFEYHAKKQAGVQAPITTGSEDDDLGDDD